MSDKLCNSVDYKCLTETKAAFITSKLLTDKNKRKNRVKVLLNENLLEISNSLVRVK